VIIPAELKSFLDDVYFFLGLLFVTMILWRLIDLGAEQVKEQASRSGEQERSSSLIQLSVRL
jgi:hypothetical protein